MKTSTFAAAVKHSLEDCCTLYETEDGRRFLGRDVKSRAFQDALAWRVSGTDLLTKADYKDAGFEVVRARRVGTLANGRYGRTVLVLEWKSNG